MKSIDEIFRAIKLITNYNKIALVSVEDCEVIALDSDSLPSIKESGYNVIYTYNGDIIQPTPILFDTMNKIYLSSLLNKDNQQLS